MREIKFRAWYKSEERMIDVARIDIVDGSLREFLFAGEFLDYWNNVILMQYIGLKDTEGKDIYEGDIVEDYDGNRYEVYYDRYKFELKGFSNASFDYPTVAFSEGVFKVVGNIYQNKDLLEGLNR